MVKLFTDRKGYKRFTNSGILVHRHVARQKLGGAIKSGYVVHHRDGNKRNNRRSNLRVISRSSHSKYHSRKRGRW
jgi:hypothetical protein